MCLRFLSQTKYDMNEKTIKRFHHLTNFIAFSFTLECAAQSFTKRTEKNKIFPLKLVQLKTNAIFSVFSANRRSIDIFV